MQDSIYPGFSHLNSLGCSSSCLLLNYITLWEPANTPVLVPTHGSAWESKGHLSKIICFRNRQVAARHSLLYRCFTSNPAAPDLSADSFFRLGRNEVFGSCFSHKSLGDFLTLSFLPPLWQLSPSPEQNQDNSLSCFKSGLSWGMISETIMLLMSSPCLLYLTLCGSLFKFELLWFPVKQWKAKPCRFWVAQDIPLWVAAVEGLLH